MGLNDSLHIGQLQGSEAPLKPIKRNSWAWLVISIIVVIWGIIATVITRNPFQCIGTLIFASPLYLIAIIISAINKRKIIQPVICFALCVISFIVVSLFGNEMNSVNDAPYVLSGAQLRNECKAYSYDEISRYPDNYKGKYAFFTGKVVQVQDQSSSGGTHAELRVDVSGDGLYESSIIYVSYNKSSTSNEPRILEGDTITMYGVLNGLITYESVFGQSITIPLINMYEYEMLN